MPNDTSDHIIAEGPAERKKIQGAGYMEHYNEPGKFGFPKGSLVKGRTARVKASAPKEETSSAPTGDLFTPDKSGVSSIHDR